MSHSLVRPLPLHIVLDSRDLFTSLSTQRQSIDKSIQADVNVIRHEFELRNVARFIWLPGKLYLSDAGTKPDSPLTEALQLSLANGCLEVDLADSIDLFDAYRPLG